MSSPLREVLEGLGARYISAEPSAAPADFGDVLAEYAAARRSAAVVDRSALSKIELRGRDRAKFLHNLCTNDIKALAAGQGCEAFFTTVQGKILAHVRVLAGSDSHWIDSIPGASATLIAHLDRYLITEKVELADRTNEFAQILLVGKRASEVLVAAIGASAPELQHLGHLEVSVGGMAAQLIRDESLGTNAFEFRVAARLAADLWRRLWQAGQPLGLRPIGEHAYEMVRVEAGLPVYGLDIDESNFPQEVGRDKLAISFTKGCYLGQETVARIDALGHVNRHLVGLLIPDDREPPDRAAAISSGGKTVGNVRSAAFSPAMNCAIALGYVRRGLESPGTELLIESQGKELRAVVHVLPFLK